MTDERQSAIENNVGLYRTVLGARGIDLRVEEGLAYTCDRAPTYYSNAVTRSASWAPDERFARIGRRARQEGWDDWSIKDSFGVLDLSGSGFERLFDAEWMHLDPGTLRSPGGRRLRFEILRTERALRDWWRGWDPDPRLGPALFGPRLLDAPDFHFVGGYAEDRLVAGCAINRTGSVLGLSNCFSQDPSAAPWSEALEAVLRDLGPARVVGYARGQLATDLREAGFVPVGRLRVWRRTPA